LGIGAYLVIGAWSLVIAVSLMRLTLQISSASIRWPSSEEEDPLLEIFPILLADIVSP
jgi:hypothetical protein